MEARGAAQSCLFYHLPATCPVQAGLCPGPLLLVTVLFTTTSFPDLTLCLSNGKINR